MQTLDTCKVVMIEESWRILSTLYAKLNVQVTWNLRKRIARYDSAMYKKRRGIVRKVRKKKEAKIAAMPLSRAIKIIMSIIRKVEPR